VSFLAQTREFITQVFERECFYVRDLEGAKIVYIDFLDKRSFLTQSSAKFHPHLFFYFCFIVFKGSKKSKENEENLINFFGHSLTYPYRQKKVCKKWKFFSFGICNATCRQSTTF